MRDDDEGEEEDRGQGGSRRGGARSKDHTSARPSAAAAGGGASAAAGGGMTVSIRQHKFCIDCADYVRYYDEYIEGRGSVPCCSICHTVIEV
jgi:hypothetical protein